MARAPAWQSLLGALLIAVPVTTALDIAFQLWLTPLGWTLQLIIGSFILKLLFGLIFAAAIGFLLGLPIARLISRQGRFRPAIVALIGAILGFSAAVLLSALGNSYLFMSGFSFWRSFAFGGLTGLIIGYLWWAFDARRVSGKAGAA